MESWYVSLAAAAETIPKFHKGKGLGPTKIPAFGDIELNKYLEIGQKMWLRALRYQKSTLPEAQETGNNPTPPVETDPDKGEFNVIDPRCEY